MEHTKKVAYLRTFSILVVAMLGGIQYYLVSNTYNLTRETYFKEVATQIDTFQKDTVMFKVRGNILSDILKLADDYAANKIGKAGFLKILSEKVRGEKWLADNAWAMFSSQHPQLQQISYLETYDWIILKKDGLSDSLLYGKDAPLQLIGKKTTKFTKDWLVIKTLQEVLVNESSSNPYPGRSYKMNFAMSRYIRSKSGSEIFMRMSLIYALSLGLITAVSLILFLNFKAIYRQKKIADIRSEFASNVTHELQTPISSIALISKTLKTRAVRSDLQLLEETLAALDRQQQRLKSSVDSALESAMLEKNDIITEPVIMPDFLRAYLNDYPKPSHIFETKLLEHIITLHTGRQALEHILQNILENAMKYSSEGTTVTITSKIAGNFYAIAISDEGPGIGQQHYNHIFKKFYRVPQHNLHAVKGIGLGLFLCSELIGRLNGFITLDSPKGKGTTFTIHLPNNENKSADRRRRS